MAYLSYPIYEVELITTINEVEIREEKGHT